MPGGTITATTSSPIGTITTAERPQARALIKIRPAARTTPEQTPTRPERVTTLGASSTGSPTRENRYS